MSKKILKKKKNIKSNIKILHKRIENLDKACSSVVNENCELEKQLKIMKENSKTISNLVEFVNITFNKLDELMKVKVYLEKYRDEINKIIESKCEKGDIE